MTESETDKDSLSQLRNEARQEAAREIIHLLKTCAMFESFEAEDKAIAWIAEKFKLVDSRKVQTGGLEDETTNKRRISAIFFCIATMGSNTIWQALWCLLMVMVSTVVIYLAWKAAE